MNLPPPGISADPDAAPAVQILLLPGWMGSGPGHWQTRWVLRHGHRLLEQSDWMRPKRGDWMARLEETVRDSNLPLLLVAHSLGCHLVSAWTAHSSHRDRVRAALLVAPPDLDRPDIPLELHGWRRNPLARLPFASHLVASSNDPYASLEMSKKLAASWGSRLTVIGEHGHVNAESGLGDWEQGIAIVDSLIRETGAARPPAR